MSFLDKIEQLQNKSEAYRWKVLIASISVLMLFVIFVWITTIDLSMTDDNESAQALEKLQEPFGVVKESIREIYTGVKNLEF